ncbi:hypothetical protein L1887_33556 [Cichorium endivia]|nr:hypothetical protein L1887_33556 [Cichorium endivia]
MDCKKPVPLNQIDINISDVLLKLHLIKVWKFTLNGNNTLQMLLIDEEMLLARGILLRVTLWGIMAHKLNDFISINGKDVLLVVVLHFLDRIGESTSSSGMTMLSSQSVSETDEFLKDRDFKKIVNILKPEQVTNHIILGTIHSIYQNKPWYYLGCSACHMKATQTWLIEDNPDGSESTQEKQILECNNSQCKKPNKEFVPSEVGSEIGENLTPCTEKSTSTSTPTNLKRKLDEFSTSGDIKTKPTFFFLKDGKQLDKLVGANVEELISNTGAFAAGTNSMQVW